MQMLHSLKCPMLMLTSSRHEKRLLWKHMQYCLEHKATFYIRNFLKINLGPTNSLVAKLGLGWEKISLSFALRQKYFCLETIKLNVSFSIMFWISILFSSSQSNFILKEFLLKQIHLYIPMCWSLHLILFL